MNHLADRIRCASGSEAIIEDIAFALALAGGFDHLLEDAPTKVFRRRRGRADVEIFTADDKTFAALGIEVKLWSQVNFGRYGRPEFTSQLTEMARHARNLVIITTPARAAHEEWLDGATILTLENLAGMVEAIGLTADDIVGVALKHSA